ncbi:MAG TPA: helix-turn-helix domain-containing protein [Rhodanobacteraceae bacterium]|nr:helix-turn-helix domain-containing protein [Rhodanobacteraceae bacterium]
MTDQKRQNPPCRAGSENADLMGRLPRHSSSRQYPRKGTARADVLDALRAGQRLTGMEAWRDFGTSRLAADVFELRRMGWPIVAETITVPARHGQRSKIARYHLPASGGDDA